MMLSMIHSFHLKLNGIDDDDDDDDNDSMWSHYNSDTWAAAVTGRVTTRFSKYGLHMMDSILLRSGESESNLVDNKKRNRNLLVNLTLLPLVKEIQQKR